MAYQTYITEGLVCGSRVQNTSDKSFLVFTREAGMVWASARSVRKESSKQRYALQEFSHIRASLVSGKGGWRFAGVESFGNLYMHAETREARTFVRNMVRLLRRVVGGETPHQDLFDDVLGALYLSNEFDHKKLELVASIRLLSKLGYISPEDAYQHLLRPGEPYESFIEVSVEVEKACKEAVTHALHESQL